jgi:hypothetical protein
MTDYDPLAKMLHDAYWRVTDSLVWQANTIEEKDNWRRVARLVDTMAVPNAPPPTADPDPREALALRQWAIGLLVPQDWPEHDMERQIQRLIALALGHPVKP